MNDQNMFGGLDYDRMKEDLRRFHQVREFTNRIYNTYQRTPTVTNWDWFLPEKNKKVKKKVNWKIGL